MVRSFLTDGNNLIVHLKVEKLDPAAWGLDATLVIQGGSNMTGTVCV